MSVASDDVDLGDGESDVVEADALKIEFLDFPLERFLAPYVVFVVAVDESDKGHLRCLELQIVHGHTVALHEEVGRIVARLEHGSLALEFTNGDDT